MKPPLRILHLEDNPDDAALVQAALETAGLATMIERVETRATFVAALDRGGWDLLLSDFSLPSFDGISALQIAREKSSGTPFIFISGTLGEDLAIESMKSGATDYVSKERLTRLGLAVHRAMKEVDDRAERRRIEAQLIEAQKMEVIGQLAGGVAHDFNNILSVILGYGDMLREELKYDDGLRKYAEEVRDAAQRAIGLTRQLLFFSRKQAVQLQVLDLNEIVQGTERLLGRVLEQHIELKIVPGDEIGCVKADPGQIGQVLMNLAINARDAMPRGGKLLIETCAATLHADDVAGHAGMPAGQYVMLSVSDTGAGMSSEVKARLFEPFFTTKPNGKGTGLGLATCNTIIKQCGGHIAVSSEPGAGTTFRIYFPRVDPPARPAAVPQKKHGLPQGSETVLLVDDQPEVLCLAERALQLQGYHVLTASNGREGLRVAYEWKGPAIRLVIADLLMPEMGGKAMVEWLRTTVPTLNVIFTSGCMDESAAKAHSDSNSAFLAKPYTPADLAKKVRELLDAPVKSAVRRKPHPIKSTSQESGASPAWLSAARASCQ